MKLGLLNWEKRKNKDLDKEIIDKGFMIIEEDLSVKNYDELKLKFDKLNERSIDLLMMGEFEKDFNYFLDFINPKDIKKQKYNVVLNNYGCAYLNYGSIINKNVRFIYGPNFIEMNSIDKFNEYYEGMTNLLAFSQSSFIVEDININKKLEFTKEKAVKGLLFGGNVNSVITLMHTDYFTKQLKNSIILIDGLSENEVELRCQLTALNQMKLFSNIKGIVFGYINNIDLKAFINREFYELERLNIVYGYSGVNSDHQAYIFIGKTTYIDPKTGLIIQNAK